MKKSAIGFLCALLLGIASLPAQARDIPYFPFLPCYGTDGPLACVFPDIPGNRMFGLLAIGLYWDSILENLDVQELNEFVNASTDQFLQDLPAELPSFLRGVAVARIRHQQMMAEELLRARETLAEIREYVDSDSPSCQVLADWAEDREVTVVDGSSIPASFSFSGAVVVAQLPSGNTVSERFQC